MVNETQDTILVYCIYTVWLNLWKNVFVLSTQDEKCRWKKRKWRLDSIGSALCVTVCNKPIFHFFFREEDVTVFVKYNNNILWGHALIKVPLLSKCYAKLPVGAKYMIFSSNGCGYKFFICDILWYWVPKITHICL